MPPASATRNFRRDWRRRVMWPIQVNVKVGNLTVLFRAFTVGWSSSSMSISFCLFFPQWFLNDSCLSYGARYAARASIRLTFRPALSGSPSFAALRNWMQPQRILREMSSPSHVMDWQKSCRKLSGGGGTLPWRRRRKQLHVARPAKSTAGKRLLEFAVSPHPLTIWRLRKQFDAWKIAWCLTFGFKKRISRI